MKYAQKTTAHFNQKTAPLFSYFNQRNGCKAKSPTAVHTLFGFNGFKHRVKRAL